MEKEPREKCSRQDNAVEKLFAEKVSDDKRQAQEEASLKNMSEAIQSAPHFTGPKVWKGGSPRLPQALFPYIGHSTATAMVQAGLFQQSTSAASTRFCFFRCAEGRNDWVLGNFLHDLGGKLGQSCNTLQGWNICIEPQMEQ